MSKKWNDEFIIDELQKYIEKNKFSLKSISKRRQDIYLAIKRKEKNEGKGFNYFISKLEGISEETKTSLINDIEGNRHKFRKYTEAIEELRDFILENGSINDLQKLNNALYIYLSRRENGLIGCLDEVFGNEYDYRKYLSQVPNKFWENENRILVILKNYILEKDTLRNIALEETSLYIQMQKRKSIKYYVEKIGYDINQLNPPKNIKKKNYWRKWINLKNEINIILDKDKLDEFPSINYLVKKGIPSCAIQYFGGIENVRKRMKYKDNNIRAIDGHMCKSNFEKIVDDFLYVIEASHFKDAEVKIADNKIIPDFMLDDGSFIEVWGLNSEEYNKKRKDKTKFYNKHLKGTLIEVEINDLNRGYVCIIKNLKNILCDYINIKLTDEELLEKIFPQLNDEIDQLRIMLNPLLIDGKCIPSKPDIEKLMKEKKITHDRGDKIINLYKKINSMSYIAKKLGKINKKKYIRNKTPKEKIVNNFYLDEEKIEKSIKELNDIYSHYGFLPSQEFIAKNYKQVNLFIMYSGGYQNVLNKYKLNNLYQIICDKAKELEQKGNLFCPRCNSDRYANSGYNNNKTFKRYDCKNKQCRKRYSSLMCAQKVIAEYLLDKSNNTFDPVMKSYYEKEAKRLLSNKFIKGY